MKIHISGHSFLDSFKRQVFLRGVNLAGSSKVPFTPNEATHLPTDFSNHKDVSFIGRPFPLEEAEEHFSRLQHWGFNTLRLLTTWEAIEHSGPQKYDQAYLDFFEKIVKLAGEYGFYVFIDPHQDVWSRMTGGDGAPGWTLELLGMNIQRLKATGAALVMQHFQDPSQYPEMAWPGNYYRYATATMFTLFFAGNDYAPNLELSGQSVQDYLQTHYIHSIAQIAKRVRTYEHVLGFGTMNEPHPGYIGYHDLNNYPELIIPGLMFTPFESFQATQGIPTRVATFKLGLTGIKKHGEVLVNPDGVSLWKEGFEDPWLTHGVWEQTKHGNARLLKPRYFQKTPRGEPADFHKHYLEPFIIAYTQAIRDIMPEAMIFIEGDPTATSYQWTSNLPKNIVNASHWYDGFTLFTKKYHKHFNYNVKTKKPVIFKHFVKKMMKQQLQEIKNRGIRVHGGIPTLIGEFGLPFDLNNKKAYKTGDFSAHEDALTLYYDLMDDLLLNCTLWNYTPDNTNQWGDQWNKEDLSIFSRDQQENPLDINSGGRALKGFVRPHPRAIPGKILSTHYNPKKPLYEAQVKHDPTLENQEYSFYVPTLMFGTNLKVTVTNNTRKQVAFTHVYKNQELHLTITQKLNSHKTYTITITKARK